MSAVYTVTLKLPIHLYNRFRQHADKTHRAVEIELLEAVAASAPNDDDLPTDLAQQLADLTTLDDAALWQAARTRLSPDEAAHLEELHFKQQREGLTSAEAERADGLIRQYKPAMLVRAQAAVLLRQRGHDISGLLQVPA